MSGNWRQNSVLHKRQLTLLPLEVSVCFYCTVSVVLRGEKCVSHSQLTPNELPKSKQTFHQYEIFFLMSYTLMDECYKALTT